MPIGLLPGGQVSGMRVPRGQVSGMRVPSGQVLSGQVFSGRCSVGGVQWVLAQSGGSSFEVKNLLDFQLFVVVS